MNITKSRLQQIIKEEIERADEGYGSSGWGGRGGRYEGGDTTGYKGRYGGTPWYRQGGSGRMSDAEARERGGRGYDERHEDEGPSRPRGGLVSSSVTIYTDPSMVSKAWRAALGSLGDQLDDHAKTYLGKLGYDGMAGNLIRGNDPTTGYSDVGPRWVLSKSPEGGYTFRVGTVIGTGETPSAALTDAAQQGFEGSEGVLEQLGVERDEFYAADRSEDERTPGGEQYVASMDDMDPMDEGDAEEEEMMESRLKRDLGKDVLTRGHSVNMQKLKTLARMMTKKHAAHIEDLEYEIAELGDIYQGEPAESPEYAELNRAEAIALRDMLVDALRKSPPPARVPQQTFDPNDTWIPDPEYGEINESARSVVGRWNKLAGTLKG